MGAEFFWLCDPERHAECGKRRCYMGGHADWFTCDATSREEYAKTGPDGTKTLLYVRITEEEKDKAGPD